MFIIRTMLWSALQATHLIHIDMEVATGLKAVWEIKEKAEENEDEDNRAKEEEVEEKAGAEEENEEWRKGRRWVTNSNLAMTK